MYRKGDAKLCRPMTEAERNAEDEGLAIVDHNLKWGGDTREDPYPDEPSTPWVQLPHSCGQWVIGGKEQVQQMILDLEATLDLL